MDVTRKFPIYEADQVLSAEHLNQSMAYLEKQDRLSRRLLHGTGTVCGLAFSLEEGVLTITKGCGITSEGYLIALEEALVLSKVRDYTPPYPPKYDPFYDGADKPFKLWEVVPETEAEGEGLQALSKLNLKDKVLLLYLEAYDKDLKDCVGDDCDNMGTVREFTIRPLLISINDLLKIFNKDGNTVEDVASDVFARNLLKEIIPPRFDVTPKNATSTLEINKAYGSLCDTLYPEIKQGAILVEALFAQALGMPMSMADAMDTIATQLEAIKKQELGQQYYFDHLCDIAAAYNELVDIATRWMVACMPDEDDFPRHLALGEFAQIKADTPKIFRHYFKHAATAPEAHRQQAHVKQLYNRLVKIIGSFELRQEKEVRVTKSNFATALSEKAIPYYYRPEDEADKSWLKSWSVRLNERGVWNKTSHYYNDPHSQLLRDLEGNNFYRIEGQLGRQYTTAVGEIKKLIQTYRLPAQVVALSTGAVPFDLNLLEECRIADLDAQFDALRDNLYCQMQEVSCFLGSIPLPGAKTNASRLAAGATAATAASGFPAEAASINTNFTNISGVRAATDRITLVRGATVKTFTKGQFIASRCTVRENTLGKMYLNLIQRDDIKGKSFLDLLLPYLNISNMSPQVRQLQLAYTFALITLDEIEELAGILDGTTLSTLNFKGLSAFSEELMQFLRLYINEINKLEREQDFEPDPIMHDLKHQLVHLLGLCKLKAFFALYKTYRSRIQQALNELRFDRFITKHPGIDHKGGVPRGGTFILVYHTTEKPDRLEAIEPKDIGVLKVVDTAKMYDDLKANNPTLPMTAAYSTASTSKAVSVNEANSWMRENLTEYAKATGRTLSAEFINRFDDLLTGLQVEREQESQLEEGVVFAEFYLPYLCCSGCGGIEINMVEPVVPISLSLPRPRYCLGSENRDEFTVSPAGGVVAGPGVEPEGDKFFFNPAAEGVKTGNITFTYTLEGRTAQTSIAVLPQPEAAFEVDTDVTPNGSYVSFRNKSTNADRFMWDFGNGQTSKAKDPDVQYYGIDAEKTVITLRAGNGVCEDTEVQTVTLFTRSYEMRIGKEKTSFCSDEKAYPIDIYIVGVGKETFPFDGLVKGKGVSEPTSANPVFMFDPTKAGVGTHKLVYDVGGNVETELTVTVVQQFQVSFSASGKRSNDGFQVTFRGITPTDKEAYFWRFDEKDPTNIETRKNAEPF